MLNSSKLSLLLGVLLLAGCNSGPAQPDVSPVKGKVLYKGTPVSGANVNFNTTGAPRAGYAVTNEAGEFEISTFGHKDGAIVGEHVVTISKPEQVAQAAPTTNAPPSPEDLAKMGQAQMNNQAQKKADNLLPAKYAKADTSPLKFTVTAAGPNDFVLELTD